MGYETKFPLKAHCMCQWYFSIVVEYSQLEDHLDNGPEVCQPGCVVTNAVNGGCFILEVCTCIW